MTMEYLKTDRYTLTTAFMLPGIGHNRRELLPYGFLNAYLTDPKHEITYDKSLYLLFKPEDQQLMDKFLRLEEQNPLFIEDYDYPGGYIVMVYRFNPKYESEYQLFIDGKYSKFSKEFIGLYPKFIDYHNRKTGRIEQLISLPYHVCNKTEGIREYRRTWLKDKLDMDMEDIEIEEYWDIPNTLRETLNIDKIKEENE